jgi:hypothetical protein
MAILAMASDRLEEALQGGRNDPFRIFKLNRLAASGKSLLAIDALRSRRLATHAGPAKKPRRRPLLDLVRRVREIPPPVRAARSAGREIRMAHNPRHRPTADHVGHGQHRATIRRSGRSIRSHSPARFNLVAGNPPQHLALWSSGRNGSMAALLAPDAQYKERGPAP